MVSENDADMLSENFLTRFKEIINFWWTFFDSTHIAFNGREPEAQQIVEYERSMIMLNRDSLRGSRTDRAHDRQDNG